MDREALEAIQKLEKRIEDLEEELVVLTEWNGLDSGLTPGIRITLKEQRSDGEA